MGFDISNFDAASAADEGREMEVLTPGGVLMKDNEGKPITIKLLGRHSEKVIQHNNKMANVRLEQARRGRQMNVNAETIREDGTELLTICTVSWSFDEMDGKPFPCTPENARKFWSDRRFAFIREQADRFIADDANFTKR